MCLHVRVHVCIFFNGAGVTGGGQNVSIVSVDLLCVKFQIIFFLVVPPVLGFGGAEG